jgi:hypothetical protein
MKDAAAAAARANEPGSAEATTIRREPAQAHPNEC